MSVVVIGLNHRTAPLELLERVAVDGSGLPKLLQSLCERPHVSEAVVLSTCNRTEIYVHAERFHGAFDDVREALVDHSHVPPEDFSEHLSTLYDADALRHLFSVACGLDSAVLGEHEILGQVRGAWEASRQLGYAGTVLNPVFRHALEVGKRARTQTSISRGVTSVSQAAVAMATERLGSLAGRRIMVLGAGDMGEGMVASLASSDADEVLVANRTRATADRLAERVGGRSITLVDLLDRLADVDLLFTSTGATSMMIEHADLAGVMALRAGRPLLVVDIAVPRDIDPAAADIDGVTLLDMDDLRAFADAGVRERRREVANVARVIDEELDRFLDVSSARRIDPLISAFRQRAEEVRDDELGRLTGRLGQLDPEVRELVEVATRRLVNKLLHDPTVRLKDAAGTARGERLAEALRDLYGLE